MVMTTERKSVQNWIQKIVFYIEVPKIQVCHSNVTKYIKMLFTVVIPEAKHIQWSRKLRQHYLVTRYFSRREFGSGSKVRRSEKSVRRKKAYEESRYVVRNPYYENEKKTVFRHVIQNTLYTPGMSNLCMRFKRMIQLGCNKNRRFFSKLRFLYLTIRF